MEANPLLNSDIFVQVCLNYIFYDMQLKKKVIGSHNRYSPSPCACPAAPRSPALTQEGSLSAHELERQFRKLGVWKWELCSTSDVEGDINKGMNNPQRQNKLKIITAIPMTIDCQHGSPIVSHIGPIILCLMTTYLLHVTNREMGIQRGHLLDVIQIVRGRHLKPALLNPKALE